MKNDILNKADISQLVYAFYDKVREDDLIGFIFNDVVKVNWEAHLPVMIDFWENTLFYTGSYEGNPMKAHLSLNKMIPLKPEFFNRWTALFSESVDGLFEGQNANLMKQRALSIATVMQIKIKEASLDNDAPIL